MKEKNINDIENHPSADRYADAVNEAVWTESSGDFSLPDYMPQIAKMLKVEARIIPSGKYIGSDRAEFSGSVVYSVLYTGEDGVPSYTNLSSDYEYSVPLGAAADCDEVEIYDEPTIESTTVRPSGPRKLSIRSRIKSLPHVIYKKPQQRAELYDEENIEYQKLRDVRNVMHNGHFESGEFELEDVFKLEGSPDAEPVGCEGSVCISEVTPTFDGVMCRGEIEYRVLYFDIEAGRRSLFSSKRKLRFEKEIAVGHMADNTFARAYGRIVSADISSAEDSSDISLSVIVNICGEYMFERKEVFVKDVYSCNCNCNVEYTEQEYKRAVLCKNLNFSYHAQKKLSEEGTASGEVCCCFGNATIESAQIKDGRAYISGEINADCIVCAPTDDSASYSNVTVSIPFKSETEVMCSAERYEVRCMPEVSGIRARVEKDGITVDAELFMSLYIQGTDSIRTVRSVSTNGDMKKGMSDCVTIYYPDKGESLWSVGKKYGISIESLSAINGVSSENFDSADSLSGLYSMIIKQ